MPNEPMMSREEDRVTVLIVDDSPENLMVLVEALGDRYRVKAVRDGWQALRVIVETPPPDLVLLDILMPGIDGYEVCRRIKADPATRDIPVIFLSALTEEGQELQGLTLGAVDFIHKPFSVPLVRARVATHLQLAEARRSMITHVQTLEEAARLRDDVENITRHDLKAPLSPILTYPDLLLRSPRLDDHERELIKAIRSAGLKLLGMINHSLDLYKMETGRYACHPQPQALSEVLRKSLDDLAVLAKRRRLTFELSLTPAWAWIEENLAYSLFSNLIKNAIEAAPNGGQVAIAMDREGDSIATHIVSPTIVPEAIRDRFFEKYATYGKPGGTGLGTYSARLMALTMKGDIRMETDPAFGTRITVLLPSS